MNRRSYLALAGTLLTAGCTGTGSGSSSTSLATESTATETDTPQATTTERTQTTQTAQTAQTAQSLEQETIGTEADLPDNISDRTIQLYNTSGSAVTVTVSKPDDEEFERHYDVSVYANLKLEIYVPADYTVRAEASENRSKTVEVTEDSFTCTSSITNLYVPESEPIQVIEHDPEAACDSSGNETTTTGTATTISAVTTADE